MNPKLEIKTTDENVARVWERFSEIAQIPRPSKGEERAVEYLLQFSKDRGLEVESDKENNVLISVPASKGKEKTLGTILQGHSDMVCVSEKEAENPSTKGVKPLVDGKWVAAKGTSLGADNGIGVATFLSITEDLFEHGPLAVLITSDEETGLNGANNLQFDLSKYKYLINGDSEDWGEATIGCAGGEDLITKISFDFENIGSTLAFTKIEISGLSGGHSALAIAEVGKANAIKLLAEVLSDIANKVGIYLVSINGGVARNVVPSSAEAIFAFEPGEIQSFDSLVKDTVKKHKEGFSHEKNIEVKVSESKPNRSGLGHEDTRKLLALINAIPHGVFVWSDNAETIPQTSTNLATIEMKNSEVIIGSMSRSSVDNQLEKMSSKIEKAAKAHGAETRRESGYSGWEPREGTRLVETTKEVYKKLFEGKLNIVQTHGGLECGIILGKYPHLEAISIGPTILGAHSINEKVNIKAVEKFYEFTKHLVKQLGV